MYFSVFVITIALGLIIKIYNVKKARWCKSKVCLCGKTVIVTGSNTGIGYETALEFAKRGARVILACRNLKKAAEARDKIISLTENQNVQIKELNFNSLSSVKDFVKDLKDSETRLDILVNNAGIGASFNKLTEDGFQRLMQINYFGPVLLTILLLDLLMKSKSRIINVSSILATNGSNLSLETLNKFTSHNSNYSNSKLANILFTIKLSELLKGTTVTTYSLHPGAVATDIFKTFTGLTKVLVDFCKILYFKTPEAGAQTTLYAALEQDIEKYSGQHFEECQKVLPYKTTRNRKLIEEIWTGTIKLLNLENEVEELFK